MPAEKFITALVPTSLNGCSASATAMKNALSIAPRLAGASLSWLAGELVGPVTYPCLHLTVENFPNQELLRRVERLELGGLYNMLDIALL